MLLRVLYRYLLDGSTETNNISRVNIVITSTYLSTHTHMHTYQIRSPFSLEVAVAMSQLRLAM